MESALSANGINPKSGKVNRLTNEQWKTATLKREKQNKLIKQHLQLSQKANKCLKVNRPTKEQEKLATLNRKRGKELIKQP